MLTYRDVKGSPLTASEGDENIRTLAAMATGGYLDPGENICEQHERYVLQPGVWTSINSYPGAGVLFRYWLAIYGGRTDASQAVAGGEVSDCRMRVKVDGEAIASVGGNNGMTMREWFCLPELPVSRAIKTYSNNLMNVSANTFNNFGAMLIMPTPFSNGCIVEFYNACPGAIEVWTMNEVNTGLSSFDYDPSFRLKAGVTLNTQVQPGAEFIMYSTRNNAILGAYFKYIDASMIDVPWSFEGNDKLKYYVSGTWVKKWDSSGVEDNQDSSYTWEQQKAAGAPYLGGRLDYRDTTYFNITASGGAQGAMYLRYPEKRSAQGKTGLQLVTTNGDTNYSAPDGNHLPHGAVSIRATYFVYEKPVVGGSGGGAVPATPLVAPMLTVTPKANGADVAWTLPTGTASVVLEVSTQSSGSGFATVYSGSNTAISLSGYPNNVDIYYRITGVPAVGSTTYTTSPYGTATARYVLNAGTGASLLMELDPGSGVTLGSGKVASHTDTVAGLVFQTSSAALRPSITAQNASANNQPTIEYTGGQKLESGNTALATRRTFCFVTVFKAAGYQVMFGNRVSGVNPINFWTLQNNAFESNKDGQGTLAWTSSDATFKMAIVQASESLIEVYVDKVLVGSYSMPPDISGSIFATGANVINNVLAQPGTYSQGIQRLYDAPLNATAFEAVHAEMKAKYALTGY